MTLSANAPPGDLHQALPAASKRPVFDAEYIREWTAEVTARAAALSGRVGDVHLAAAAIRQRAWQARLRARATRDHSAALRQRFDWELRPGSPDARVRWFSLTGQLGSHEVWARWDDGRLRCDPELMTQARLLVEMGTVFVHHDPPARVHATLTGPAAAVMLTLAKACDSVGSIDFDPKSAV